ncbi:MAG: hypothetical protein FWF94_03140 [Oscillospiraceae bacterium]|nr:hypothetical protein [Oscillospiraceae bacterium]
MTRLKRMENYNLNMKEALSKFISSFLTNLRTIIFAFIISVIIWLAISFQFFPDIILTVEVPVSAEPTAYMNDVSLELADELDETVTVSFEGKRSEISSLNADDFYAYLDFSDIKMAGYQDVAVKVKVKDELNARFLRTDDSVLRTVKIIQTAEKTLRIIPDVQKLETTGGMMIESAGIVITPDVITISGEKPLIDSVHSVRVRVVSDEPLITTTVLNGELEFLDSRGNIILNDGIYTEERAFNVTVPVFKRKTLPLEVSIIAPDNFELDSLYNKMSIEPKDLTIASPNDSIDNLEGLNIGTISLSDITLGYLENGIPIQITLPEGYENISGNNEVRVIFDEIGDYDVRTFQVSTANFNNLNIPSGFKVDYITRTITVKVVGPSNVIYSMTSADIIGAINFAGVNDISVGEHSIGVRLTVEGSNVYAWAIGDYKIDIEVSN